MHGKLSIPAGVQKIGAKAFGWCYGFTEIEFGEWLVERGDSAFYYCYNAANSLTRPESLQKIGNSAFAHCRALPAVGIGNSVSAIGTDAFLDCSALKNLYLANPNGWWRTDVEGTRLMSATELSDSQKAAVYFTKNYVASRWENK